MPSTWEIELIRASTDTAHAGERLFDRLLGVALADLPERLR